MKSDDGKMVVEFAKASDAVEIGNLSQHYVEHGLGWRYTPSRIKKLISNKSKNVVVARNDDELVGFGIMTYERDQANLDLLGVKVSYRRQGIGTLVCKLARRSSRSRWRIQCICSSKKNKPKRYKVLPKTQLLSN